MMRFQANLESGERHAGYLDSVRAPGVTRPRAIVMADGEGKDHGMDIGIDSRVA